MGTKESLSRNGAAVVGAALKVWGSRRLESWTGIACVAAGQALDTTATFLSDTPRTSVSDTLDLVSTIAVTQSAKSQEVLSVQESRWHAVRGVAAFAIDMTRPSESETNTAINSSAGVYSTIASAIGEKLRDKGDYGFAGYAQGAAKLVNLTDAVSLARTVQGEALIGSEA